MFNKNMEVGFYNILNLCVFDNEEYWFFKRFWFESFFLYVKSLIFFEFLVFCIKWVLNCNRILFFRFIKSIDRNGKVEKGIIKINKNDEFFFNVYVYDLVIF